MKSSLYVAAGLAVVMVLLLPLILAATPMLQDGDHRHFYLETGIAEVRIEANSTNARQGTQIAMLMATRQVLPSPTPLTLTPTTPPSFTPTRTPQGNAPSPTPETNSGLTRTPLTAVPTQPTLTPTKTATGQPSAVATRPPILDPEYTCQVITNDNLTRRITPSPAAQSLGTITEGATLTIHPYDGSIPLNSTLWYVRIADSSGGGWALYARIDASAGSTEPRVTESYMDSVNAPCIPALRRQ